MSDIHETPEPNQADVFAASEPFLRAGQPGVGQPGAGQSRAEQPFSGIDGFNPAGPALFAAPLGQVQPLDASCIDVHRSLSVFLDGELAIPQANAVQRHLVTCGPCQSAQAFQMQLRTTVASRALDPMPEDVRSRITRALGFEQAVPRPHR